mmetsp:Transcript_15016/g.32770  ORF Transcript_15016/g.32770 Transcript_15016/m.32770 type:complete len:379 (+) Transcript_15016:148-1284(+)
MDAPPAPFLSAAPSPFFSTAPNANPALGGAAPPGSSFFSSLDVDPKEKSDLAGAAEEAGGAAPKLNPPPEDASSEASPSSRPRFDLAGVFAGVLAGVAAANLNPPPPPPPLPLEEAPKLKPPAPMLGFPPPLFPSPSSRPRLALAGVAPPNVTPPPDFLSPSPLGASLGLMPKANPPAADGAGDLAAAGAGAPNEKPPAPMLAFCPLPTASVAPSDFFSLPSPPPGFSVSHARHLAASDGFLVVHTSHFHSPGLDLKMSPHPEAAGAGAAGPAASLEEDCIFFNAAPGDGVFDGVFAADLGAPLGLWPNLNAMGVSTLDEAATPPGMKLNGAPGVAAGAGVALAATISSAFFNKAGVDTASALAVADAFLGWGVPLLL